MNFFFSRQVRQDALDRDLLAEPLQALALGAEHLRHAARLELLDDAVSLLAVGHGLGAVQGPWRRLPP